MAGNIGVAPNECCDRDMWQPEDAARAVAPAHRQRCANPVVLHEQRTGGGAEARSSHPFF